MSANIFKSNIGARWCPRNFRKAKPAFSSFRLVLCIFTIHTYVVRLSFATKTKVLTTLITTNSILCHVDCCAIRYRFSFVIFHIEIWLTWFNLNNCVALALDQVWIRSNLDIKSCLLYRFIIFSHQLFNFWFSNNFWAFCTLSIFKYHIRWIRHRGSIFLSLTLIFEFYQLISCIVLETGQMEPMIAFSWKQHLNQTRLFIALSNLFQAVFA